MVVEIKTIEQFKSVVGDENTGLVIIDFFAQWCGPCKIIAPKFLKMSEKHTKVGFYKIDADNNEMQNICTACNIQSLPTFCFFLKGKYITNMAGADDKKLEKLIIQYTPKSKVTETEIEKKL